MELDFSYVSELLQALLMAVLPVLAGQIALILAKRIQLERGKLGEQQQIMLGIAMDTAVFAAEQLYGAAKGDEKKAYALDVAEKWLAQYKISVDLDVLEAALEAAVKQSFDKPALAQAGS